MLIHDYFYCYRPSHIPFEGRRQPFGEDGLSVEPTAAERIAAREVVTKMEASKKTETPISTLRCHLFIPLPECSNIKDATKAMACMPPAKPGFRTNPDTIKKELPLS